MTTGIGATGSTTSGASGTPGSAPLVINGLVSGINTSQVIQALLQSYSIPITDLQNQQKSLNGEASDYQAINTDLQALQVASLGLNTANSWNLRTASSSNSAVASASAGPGAITGSLSFNVNQLAAANVLVSANGAASSGSIVTTAPSILVATGGAALGFSGFAAAGGLAVGKHTITVTQSSSAAVVTAAKALPASTAITTGTNDTLSVTVGATVYNLTLPASSGESPSQVVAAINSLAKGAGAQFTAGLTSSGALQLSTNEQGSAASISVGGNAATTLGLSVGQSATGTNAVVTVDGTSTTLSAINPGGQVTLAAPSGSITATVASQPGLSGALVSAGTANAAVVSTGNGSLSAVASAIAQSGLGVTAEAVQQASGTYLLQVAATNTGLSGAVSIDQSALSSGPLGAMTTISQAQDALVTVGGGNGYQLSSSTDTFNGLLQGTAVTVASTGSATVTVSPDAAGEATQVSNLVKAANTVLADIQKYAGYDATTKQGGPLMGSSVLTGIQQSILGAFASAIGTSGLGSSSDVGVTLNKDGTLSFNQAKFEAAYAANPTQVAALFTQGGTFSPASGVNPGAVSFVYANNQTAPGTYSVVVSHSATQAVDQGSVVTSGTTSAAENLTIQEGSLSANYAVTSGEALTSVASGLNAAFAAAGMSLTASVVNSGQQLQILSDGYGSAAQFSVTSDTASGPTGLGGPSANTAVSFTGADVVGSINGVAASGSGQTLIAPQSDPTLQGMSVLVGQGGITTSTKLGSITYTPGLAQQLLSLSDLASNPVSGSITTTIQSLQNEATGLNSQIFNYAQLETNQQTVLQNEFAKMETTLGSLKTQSSSLASAISGLAGW